MYELTRSNDTVTLSTAVHALTYQVTTPLKHYIFTR
jgi:hypothetical protein